MWEWGEGCRGEKNAIRLVSRDKTKIKKDADSGSSFSPNGQKQTERVRRNQIREEVKKDEKNLKALETIRHRRENKNWRDAVYFYSCGADGSQTACNSFFSR